MFRGQFERNIIAFVLLVLVLIVICRWCAHICKILSTKKACCDYCKKTFRIKPNGSPSEHSVRIFEEHKRQCQENHERENNCPGRNIHSRAAAATTTPRANNNTQRNNITNSYPQVVNLPPITTTARGQNRSSSPAPTYESRSRSRDDLRSECSTPPPSYNQVMMESGEGIV